MRIIATLINKEKLRSNYKLTFNNKQGSIFVILYKTQQAIFTNLRTEIDYCFSYFQGKKYFFIKPLSIQELEKSNFAPVRQLNIKNAFLNKLHRELDLKPNERLKLDKEKLTSTQFFKIIRTVKSFILNERIYGELNLQEQAFLNELKTIFNLNNLV